MDKYEDVYRQRSHEVLRAWRVREAKAAAGRLRDLRRRVEKRLDWYQRDKPICNN